MKLFLKLTVLVALIWSSTNYAQTAGFSYQALILDTSTIEVPSTDIQPQIPLDSEPVELRFTIDYTVGGIAFSYIEVHSLNTDENGMVQVIVGQGVVLSSFTFDEIIWDGKQKLLTVELNIIDSTTGFIPLDTQEILYTPHPSNPLDIFNDPSELLVLTDKKVGDIVWVRDTDGSINFDGSTNPSLFILNIAPNTWMPVAKDFDPENEQAIITVATLADRSSRFLPTPLPGDQVYIIDQDFIQVFNGTDWITILSSINLSAANGITVDKTDADNPIIELGGVLTRETNIITTSAETLAITGLDSVSDLSDRVIVQDSITGVLKKISFDDIFLNKAIEILPDSLGILGLTDKKESDLIWVKDYDGNTNSTLLILDDTGLWTPVTKDFDPENELRADIDILADDLSLPTDKLEGDLIWVKDYLGTTYPTLLIFDGTTWLPVNNDYDLDNERNLKTVADVTERDSEFPTPQSGDQVFIEQFGLIQVYDGAKAAWINTKSIVPVTDDVERDNLFPIGTQNIGDQVFITGNNTLQVYTGMGGGSGWINVVNASSLSVRNGLNSDISDGFLKLGGPLTEPTIITTDPTQTLAIDGLVSKNKATILTTDGFVLADANGVLSKMTTEDFLLWNSVQIYPTFALLDASIDNKTGDLGWVLEYRNVNTPTLFIYDSAGLWRPIIKNGKLFEFATEVIRDADYTTTLGQAGDLTYITGVGVQVFDGSNWVTLLSSTRTEITTNPTTLNALPTPDIGTTVWVEDAAGDGSNNPSLFIYDNTGTWVTVNKDFDPENEKLIVVADDAERLLEFGATPEIGSQVFNQTSGSIEVWDGSDWISASNTIQIVALTTDLPTIPAPDRGTMIWVEDADGNNNPSLFIYDDVTSSWLRVHNEFKLPIVADDVQRLADFPTPVMGDQVFNQDTESIEVWIGSAWVSPSKTTAIFNDVTAANAAIPSPEEGTIIWVRNYLTYPIPTLLIYDGTVGDWVPTTNIEADNGLNINTTNGVIELGGVLSQATTIETSATGFETLAIEGLELSSDPLDNFVVIDEDGVLKQKSLDEILEKPFAERFNTAAATITNTTADFRINFNNEDIVPDATDFVTSTGEITVVEPGVYKITYRITAEITSLDASLTNNNIEMVAFTSPSPTGPRTVIPGSVSWGSFNRVNDKVTLTATRIVTLAAGTSISVGANVDSTSTSDIQTIANGSTLMVEFIRD